MTEGSAQLLLSEGKQLSLPMRHPLVSTARHLLCNLTSCVVICLETILRRKLGDMGWWCRVPSAHRDALSSAPSHHVRWLTGSQPHITPDPRRPDASDLQGHTHWWVYTYTETHEYPQLKIIATLKRCCEQLMAFSVFNLESTSLPLFI